MAHLIVGDGHYTGEPTSLEGWQALLQRARAAGVQELSILGDFLELWIGLAGLERPWHEALFAPLKALRQEGVRLRYIVGNKDYYIADWNRRHGIFDEVHERQCRLDSAVGPLVLEHGDLVNKADRQYRLWRAFSRSAPISWLVRCLPRRWLAKKANAVAEAMQSTNRYHKSYFPEEQLRARAKELPRGAATLIYGHFHVHRELVEGDKRVITLPFLGSEHAGLWLDHTGIHRFP